MVTDHRNFCVASDLSTLLKVPSVDALVVALLPHTAVPGDLEEGLYPEERRVEHVLKRVHLGAAWAIRSTFTV